MLKLKVCQKKDSNSQEKTEGESTEKMISHLRELMDIHKGFANNMG